MDLTLGLCQVGGPGLKQRGLLTALFPWGLKKADQLERRGFVELQQGDADQWCGQGVTR